MLLDQCPGARRQFLRFPRALLALGSIAVDVAHVARAIIEHNDSGLNVAPTDSSNLVAPPGRPEIHAEQGTIALAFDCITGDRREKALQFVARHGPIGRIGFEVAHPLRRERVLIEWFTIDLVGASETIE